jgi:hypothetical protein
LPLLIAPHNLNRHHGDLRNSGRVSELCNCLWKSTFKKSTVKARSDSGNSLADTWYLVEKPSRRLHGYEGNEISVAPGGLRIRP